MQQTGVGGLSVREYLRSYSVLLGLSFLALKCSRLALASKERSVKFQTVWTFQIENTLEKLC